MLIIFFALHAFILILILSVIINQILIISFMKFNIFSYFIRYFILFDYLFLFNLLFRFSYFKSECSFSVFLFFLVVSLCY